MQSKTSFLIGKLEKHIVEKRLIALKQALKQKTGRVAVLLDRVNKEGNLQMILRTCEALGIKEVYIIQNEDGPVNLSRSITKGGDKWLEVFVFSNDEAGLNECYNQLQAKNYQLTITHLEPESYRPENVPIENKLVLVFGEERWGVSDFWKSKAELSIYLPMFGLTESFNVATACAISLYTILNRIRSGEEKNWRLSENEAEALQLQWYSKATRDGEFLLNHYNKEWKKDD